MGLDLFFSSFSPCQQKQQLDIFIPLNFCIFFLFSLWSPGTYSWSLHRPDLKYQCRFPCWIYFWRLENRCHVQILLQLSQSPGALWPLEPTLHAFEELLLEQVLQVPIWSKLFSLFYFYELDMHDYLFENQKSEKQLSKTSQENTL